MHLRRTESEVRLQTVGRDIGGDDKKLLCDGRTASRFHDGQPRDIGESAAASGGIPDATRAQDRFLGILHCVVPCGAAGYD